MTIETQVEPVEGLVVDEVEALARFMNPELFCGDPHREHRAASPRKVEYEQEAAKKAAEAILSHLSPRIAQQTEEVARLREALADIDAEMQFPNPLESGFVHGRMTFADMQRRIETTQSICRAALNEQPGGEG